jgi:hypothetical protein
MQKENSFVRFQAQERRRDEPPPMDSRCGILHDGRAGDPQKLPCRKTASSNRRAILQGDSAHHQNPGASSWRLSPAVKFAIDLYGAFRVKRVVFWVLLAVLCSFVRSGKAVLRSLIAPQVSRGCPLRLEENSVSTLVPRDWRNAVSLFD